MPKVDISITRSLTVNTGNYESIKPTITLTAKDVNAEQVSDAYLAIDDAITGLIKLEVLASSAEMTKINGGLDRYCQTVSNNQAEIGKKIDDSLNELTKY